MNKPVKKFQVVDATYLDRQFKRKNKTKKVLTELEKFNPFASLTKEDLMIGINNIKENR